MDKNANAMSKISRLYLSHNHYVLADDRSYQIVEIKGDSTLSAQVNNSSVQYFNIFCGVFEYFSQKSYDKLISGIDQKGINVHYEDALLSNLKTVKTIEIALTTAIKMSDSLLDFSTASHLRTIYEAEKGHYKLVESDLAKRGDFCLDSPCISDPLVNFINTIEPVNLSDSLLAVGLVLEFNSLQVNKNKIGDVLTKTEDSISAFYSVHSFDNTELEHFSNNVHFIASLSVSRKIYILRRVQQVIDLMYQGLRNHIVEKSKLPTTQTL